MRTAQTNARLREEGTALLDHYQELMQAAESEAGLHDFGADTFVEGLERLVTALRDEADLNAFGTGALRARILGHLKQRLQVEDWYRRHPEIEEVEIKPPLFWISLPRTGSTALSFLLAEDPKARYLRNWESAQPCPPPSTVKGPDPRRRVTGEADRKVSERAHTPSRVDGPMECQDLMALDFKSQIFQAFAHVPSYPDWLLDADLTSTYVYERRVLKLLQWGEPARPWRLKAPTHLVYMKYLDSAFPDARFVMTHRDPMEVVLWVARVYADVRSNFSDHVDLPYLGELNLRTWSEGMKRALDFRDQGADHRFYDIDFAAMNADPIAEVRGLYAWLDEPVSEAFEARMARWWTENSQSRESSPGPHAAQFGLGSDEIQRHFADYLKRMTSWTQRQPEHPQRVTLSGMDERSIIP